VYPVWHPFEPHRRGGVAKAVHEAVASDALVSELIDAMLNAPAALWKEYYRLHALVENFDHYYGSFITRHLYDIAALIAPFIRFSNSRLLSVLLKGDFNAAVERGERFVRFVPQRREGRLPRVCAFMIRTIERGRRSPIGGRHLFSCRDCEAITEAPAPPHMPCRQPRSRRRNRPSLLQALR
jgi:hypothetical protein